MELHRQFYALQVGLIEEVKVNKEKGFGFVRYRTNKEAAAAIQAGNGRVICGRSVKVGRTFRRRRKHSAVQCRVPSPCSLSLLALSHGICPCDRCLGMARVL